MDYNYDLCTPSMQQPVTGHLPNVSYSKLIKSNLRDTNCRDRPTEAIQGLVLFITSVSYLGWGILARDRIYHPDCTSKHPELGTSELVKVPTPNPYEQTCRRLLIIMG